MSLLDYIQNKNVRIVLCIVVLFIVFPTLFRIFFAAKDEISFAAGTGFSTCSDFFIDDESELARCTSNYNVTVGNTGTNNQELIVVNLSNVPEGSRVAWNVVDIVATNRRPVGPIVENRQIEDILKFEIRDLEPNRLVELNILSQGVEASGLLEDIALSIESNGSQVETNPRLTVVLRFFRSVAGIFGF